MRIINVTPEMTVLPLGRLGENESTKFIFDVSDWLEQYPDATIGLANKLPHASASYPCTLEEEEDGKVSWTITSAELSVEGKGKCQLQAVEGSTVEKKKIYTTDIGEALDPDADPPEEWESYVTAVTALKGDAEDAAEDAEAYAVGKRGGVDVDSDDPAYHNNAKYYAETVDPSIKADKVSGATSGNFAGLDENGNLTDSGHKHSDYLTSHQDITGKADKVTSATNGNFAGLDSNGNLTDSGKKASDFLTSHQDITGKADKVSSATENNFAALDSNGNLKDSGKKASDFLTGDVVSGKADKVSGGTENNFAALDSSGNLKDSGHKHSDYLTAHQDITGKADKVSSPTSGNFAGLDENGNLTDSGHKHSDYLTSHQDISGKSNLTNLAPAFSASSTYAVGDHVTYDGKYYVCSTAISTAAAWDSSKWTEKTVGAEAQSVLNEITQTQGLLNDVAERQTSENLFDGNFDETGYIDANGADASSNNYKRTSAFYPIDGTTYSTLYSYNEDDGGTTNICFYDANKSYLGYADIAGVSQSRSIPTGTAFFRVYRNATKTKSLTLTYEYVGHYVPYVNGVVIKDKCVAYESLDDDLRGNYSDASYAKEMVDLIAEKKATDNLFDNDFDESGYIDDANGDKASSSFKRTSKYYPIDDSNPTLYSYNEDSGNTTNLLFYTSAKVFISRVDIASASTSKSIPSGAKYFRLYRNATKTGNITLTYAYAGHYIPYRRWTAIKDNCVGYNAMDADAKVYANPLYGKKILVFGDSIWGNDRTDGVCDFLAQYSGATIYNGAVGGTRITDLRTTDSPAYLPFDGVKLVHALMTDTWTDQEANKASVISYVAEDTLPMLEDLDASTLDMIIISYGRNDITSSETLAQNQSALATIIDDIQSHYPTIRILVLTPIWGMFESKTVDGDNYTSTGGMTLRSLADGMMAKAKEKHVSSCDMLENMQLSQNTMATYMDSDEVHLNAKGNAMYAHIVHGKLRSLF